MTTVLSYLTLTCLIPSPPASPHTTTVRTVTCCGGETSVRGAYLQDDIELAARLPLHHDLLAIFKLHCLQGISHGETLPLVQRFCLGTLLSSTHHGSTENLRHFPTLQFQLYLILLIGPRPAVSITALVINVFYTHHKK